MCDSFVALKNTTADGVTILAKNSDRPPNEGQHLLFVPAAGHPARSSLRCTYIEIPQVPHTHAVLLSKPYWMWGAEIGINDHGVAIGNEAIFSRIPAEKTGKLLGMDLLRLGLERAASAREAVSVIVELLEQYGQGGNCVATGKLYYHNSYIIADPDDAWVLETVGERYAAKRVNDIYSISNCLSIQHDWDLASDDLAEHAVRNGWAKSDAEFDFARDYSDLIYTTFARGRVRRTCTADALRGRHGRVTVRDMMKTLRTHTAAGAAAWEPQHGLFTEDVCMHAGFGPVRDSQSTSSMVFHLQRGHPTVFFTGTSAPCTSLFKPVWPDAALPDSGPAPTNVYDTRSLYWQHERLHRAVVADYGARFPAYAQERDTLEAEFVEGALKIAAAPPKERADYAASCYARAAAAEADWLARVEAVPANADGDWLYRAAWRKFNSKAHMPQS
ncbi:MAG TPA: C69 family dipeptidase [Anaerolineales bacterium]|jgi:dipeptidase